MTEKKIRYEKPVLTDLTGPEVRKAQGVAARCRTGNTNPNQCNTGNTARGSCRQGNSVKTS